MSEDGKFPCLQKEKYFLVIDLLLKVKGGSLSAEHLTALLADASIRVAHGEPEYWFKTLMAEGYIVHTSDEGYQLSEKAMKFHREKKARVFSGF